MAWDRIVGALPQEMVREEPKVIARAHAVAYLRHLVKEQRELLHQADEKGVLVKEALRLRPTDYKGVAWMSPFVAALKGNYDNDRGRIVGEQQQETFQSGLDFLSPGDESEEFPRIRSELCDLVPELTEVVGIKTSTWASKVALALEKLVSTDEKVRCLKQLLGMSVADTWQYPLTPYTAHADVPKKRSHARARGPDSSGDWNPAEIAASKRQKQTAALAKTKYMTEDTETQQPTEMPDEATAFLPVMASTRKANEFATMSDGQLSRASQSTGKQVNLRNDKEGSPNTPGAGPAHASALLADEDFVPGGPVQDPIGSGKRCGPDSLISQASTTPAPQDDSGLSADD